MPSARRPPAAITADTHWWGAALVVFGVALAVRIAYLLSIRDAYFFARLETEPLRYHQWAVLILAGRPPLPPFEQAPGYPYFVAAVYALFGRSPTAVAAVQCLLDAGTCALMARVATQWFGRRAGWLAGLMAAVYGPLVFFASELVPATLFVFTCVAAVAAASRPRSVPALGAPGSAVRWTAAGALWAVGLLVRSEVLLGLPLVLIDAWRRGSGVAVRRVAWPPGLVVVLMLVVNALRTGTLVPLTTSGGVNLWLGNNPHADGVNPFIGANLQPVVAAVRQQATNAVAADRLFHERARAFVHANPVPAARLLWKKFLWTWTDRELPNTCDIEWTTEHSWLVRRPWFPLSFGMVLPLAVAGAWLLGGGWRDRLLLLVPLAIALGTSVLFFTNARFRLPMVPTVVWLAAVAVDRVPMLRQRRCAAVGAVVGAAIGAVVAWGDFWRVRQYRIAQLDVNTGVLAREAGDLSTAVHFLRTGLAADPHDPIGWVHLALALEEAGDPRAAAAAYRDAVGHVPGDASLREMAGRFAARHPDLLRGPGRDFD